MSQDISAFVNYSIPMAYNALDKSERAVRNWLFVSLLLVMAMIVLGGATRLTNSGLSITEWLPVKGALPPLSEAAWQVEFQKYQKIPEFMAEHSDMDMAGFKSIYFWEWSHRQLGRLIGLVYALPFFWFAIRRKLPSGQGLKFFFILLLIGLQGGIGWWMVASGLVNDRVDVSQYRLATHLGMAFIILGGLFWLWRNQSECWPQKPLDVVAKKRTTFLAGLVFLQIIAGAFVAGLKAGRTYNTWPLMDGDIIPAGYGDMAPFWRNMFENIGAVQFNHRFLAYIILAVAIWVYMSSKRNNSVQKFAFGLLILLIWQVGLGIWTLLTGDALWLALLHQFSAIFVFLAAIAMMRAARKRQF